MRETGSLPVVSSTATEQRNNGKKRKLADLAVDTDATNRSEELTTTPGGRPYRDSAFPANLSHSTRDPSGREVRISQSIASSHHEQRRNRDSLLAMNASAAPSAQVEQAAVDEASDETDEAELQGMSRMLDDGKGRMRMSDS